MSSKRRWRDEADDNDSDGPEGFPVFASRLPKWWGDEDLATEFAQFGEINLAVISRERVHEGSFVDDTRPPKSLGFGFITFVSEESQAAALQKGTILPTAVVGKGRVKTIRINVVVDKESKGDTPGLCLLWKRGLCPFNTSCKFEHTGPGGCVPGKGDGAPKPCWDLKKKGSCKKGDECPFSHDVEPAVKPAFVPRSDSEKPCRTFAKKGKCRKEDDCPYMHDVTAFDAKKKRKEQATVAIEKSRKKAKKVEALANKNASKISME